LIGPAWDKKRAVVPSAIPVTNRMKKQRDRHG
jgi:hypothetical protein